MKHRQGFILSIELTDQKLYLKILRLLPISKVRLKDIDYMRVSNFNEYLEFTRRSLHSQFWPTFFRGFKKKTAPIYMLKIKNGKRRLFLRLSSGFHYRLRTYIGRNNNHHSERPPAPW